MEQNKFFEKLSEFAELRKVKVAKSAGLREADTACDIFRNGETFIIDKDNNSTWAWEIKKLKPIIKPCEDCGQECKDRKVNKVLYTFPQRHWRRHCTGCNRVQHPDTGEFTLTPTQTPSYFVAWFKKQG
jgi:hypothetical protein